LSLGETVTLTVMHRGGLALPDLDAARRLVRLGYKPKEMGRKTTPHSETQRVYLRNRGIRDIDHYRQIVGDPLSVGPIHQYVPGQSLLMQRTVRAKTGVVYYFILDTAIGCREDFLEIMLKEKRITIR
jgi:hypothetical protein